MILRAWSTDIDGNRIHPEDNWEIVVENPAEASAHLASELVNTASDEFLQAALGMWFLSGNIISLHEGGEVFWNVELIND